jgi:UDP-N-acetylglucosamine 2-epimerase (non-hydrolysing)
MIKVAPLLAHMQKYDDIEKILLHTGQHYDEQLSGVFIKELAMPRPDIYLRVGSGSHGGQTARIMVRLEKALIRIMPDLVIVAGDVNSTLAAAVTAAKLSIPVAHVEAGLRSFNRLMPEEINRVVTDHLSDYLFASCEGAVANLKEEGIAEEKIHFVGNVMIDSIMKYRDKAQKSKILSKLRLKNREYAVLTLHRPDNVDRKECLYRILRAVKEIQKKIKVVFPLHPRTGIMIKRCGFSKDIIGMKNLLTMGPLGYPDFIRLISRSKLVFTDSGGVQEETTILQVPCLTLRHNTERPVTVTEGTNTIVGDDKDRIIKETENVLNNRFICSRKAPRFWDGKAAERIVSIILKRSR